MALTAMTLLPGVLIATIFRSFGIAIPASFWLVPCLITCLTGAHANYFIHVMNQVLPPPSYGNRILNHRFNRTFFKIAHAPMSGELPYADNKDHDRQFQEFF